MAIQFIIENRKWKKLELTKMELAEFEQAIRMDNLACSVFTEILKRRRIDNWKKVDFNQKTKEWDERHRVITFNGPENRP